MNTRAIIFPQAGTAEIREIEVNPPQRGEIMVRNAACGICQIEIKKFRGLADGTYPAGRLGHEGIGYVEAVGEGVQGLEKGDLVTTLWYRSFQEYTVGRADWAMKLEPMPREQLPCFISEPPACALNGATAATIDPAAKICVLGAGYMGLLVVQLLTRSLASKLAVADLDPARLALAKTLGATDTINARETDLVQHAERQGGFDVVIEATGAPKTIETASLMTRRGGQVVLYGDHAHQSETVAWKSFGCRKLVFALPLYHRDFAGNWRQAVELMKAGIIDQRKLITHTWPAAQCQQAMEIASRQAQGYVKGCVLWD